jgi:arylsulfatase
MRTRALKIRLATVIAVGLAVGALGLLEPLLGYWGGFHLLGIGWPTLLLLYLGGGLLLSILAGAIVTLGYARHSSQWLPITALAHYATATIALVGVVILALPIHYELRSFGLPSSCALVTPVLLVLAALLTVKALPRLVTPFFSWFLGKPSGRVAGARVAIVLILIGLIVPLTVLQGEQTRRQGHGRPPRLELRTRPGGQAVQNVLLITIDALRADRLGAYGYRRPTSPRLDSLAAHATLFEHCFAQGNVTELSMGALFTSLYPSMHGVRRHQQLAGPLAPEIETIAENLRDAGLRTAGLMSNPLLKREWGLTQGFDRCDEFQYGYLSLLPVRLLKGLHWITPPARIGNLQVPIATVVTDRALAELNRLKAEPFFLFVHYMDVHHPYLPPERFEVLFRTPGASPLEAKALWKRSWPLFKELPSDREIISQADLRRFGDLYDGCIRYVDNEIGRLLEGLRARGLDRNTLLVITADHGDEFLEHGYMFHLSPYLYDELTHVPLLVHWPGQTDGRRVPETVRLIDVMPTLLAACDLPPCPAAQGRSLLPLLRGDGGWTEVDAISQSYECVALRTPLRKLMLDLPRDRAFGYRLDVDPLELQNVAGQDPGCDALQPVLDSFIKRAMVFPAGLPPTELDPRTRELLRSIGYVSM